MTLRMPAQLNSAITGCGRWAATAPLASAPPLSEGPPPNKTGFWRLSDNKECSEYRNSGHSLFQANASQPSFRINALTTTRNSTRTKPVPRCMATRVPSMEPSTLHTAMGSATWYSTCPVEMK